MHVRKCTWNIFYIQSPEGLPHTSLYKVSLCASESDCNFGKDTPCFLIHCVLSVMHLSNGIVVPMVPPVLLLQ